MARITVQPVADDEYLVTVDEDGSSTTHTVTVGPAEVSRLGGGATALDLIRASFAFLLEREPKESILRRFDLPVIARYFPEYPDRIGDHL